MKIYRLKNNQTRCDALPANMKAKLNTVHGRGSLVRELVEAGGKLEDLTLNYQMSITDTENQGKLWDMFTEAMVIARYGDRAASIMEWKKSIGATEADPDDPNGGLLYRLRKSHFKSASTEMQRRISVSGSSQADSFQIQQLMEGMSESVLPSMSLTAPAATPKPKAAPKVKKEEDTSPRGKVFCSCVHQFQIRIALCFKFFVQTLSFDWF